MKTSVAIHNKEHRHSRISPRKSLNKLANKYQHQQQNNKKPQQQPLGCGGGSDFESCYIIEIVQFLTKNYNTQN